MGRFTLDGTVTMSSRSSTWVGLAEGFIVGVAEGFEEGSVVGTSLGAALGRADSEGKALGRYFPVGLELTLGVNDGPELGSSDALGP